MKALLINQSKSKLNERAFQAVLDSILKRLNSEKALKNRSKIKRSEISFAFVSAFKIKALNSEFRGKKYATDVLSFAPTDTDSLGELILCLSVLKKQARQNGHSLGHEITYMLIHGILHLLGYDHELSKAQEKKMFQIQDRLFSQLTESKINLNLIHVNRS